MSGANTFGGQVSIFTGGSIIASTLNSVVGGTASSNLGAPLTAEAGTFILGGNAAPGNLDYNGRREITDRAISHGAFSTGSNDVIDQSGNGLLKFTNGITNAANSKHVIILQGSTGGTGEISGAITQLSVGSVLGLTTSGTGTWTLSGPNTYAGDTTVFSMSSGRSLFWFLPSARPGITAAAAKFLLDDDRVTHDYGLSLTITCLYSNPQPLESVPRTLKSRQAGFHQ